MFARNEHDDLPHEKETRANGEPVLSRRKKKSSCGDDRLHKAVGQGIRAPTTDVEVRHHNSRIIEPTRQDCFVKCGIHIVANSGAEVVFHLGVTTGYALTEFVVYWGS